MVSPKAGNVATESLRKGFLLPELLFSTNSVHLSTILRHCPKRIQQGQRENPVPQSYRLVSVILSPDILERSCVPRGWGT